MTTLKLHIEKHLIRTVSETSSKKNLYGKSLTDQLDNLINMLNLTGMYQLKKLGNECVQATAFKFSKKQCELNPLFESLDQEVRMSIFGIRVDLLEERLHQSELKLKQISDENLKQKFEIKHLENLLNTKSEF
jgi:hypothetical protein